MKKRYRNANFRCHTGIRQTGVAVITALLLTTLAVTIVASLFWQQQVQVRAIENQRMQLQKQWILRGALDWAMLILRTTFKNSEAAVTLQETWAVGLAETRLDSYVENGRSDSEATNATISGKIIDAQSMLNLRNLSVNGKISETSVAVFEKLLSALNLNPDLAKSVAQTMAVGQAKALPLVNPPPVGNPAPAGNPPLLSLPTRLEFVYLQDLLSVPGFTPEIEKKLREYVVFLPTDTAVNVNTASAEVLYAIIVGFSLTNAKAFVLAREKSPLTDITKAKDAINRYRDSTSELDSKLFNVNSSYFFVDGKVKLNRAGLNVRTLIERTGTPGNAKTKIKWVREEQ